MDSKSRALNKNPSVLAQPDMWKRDKSIYLSSMILLRQSKTGRAI